MTFKLSHLPPPGLEVICEFLAFYSPAFILKILSFNRLSLLKPNSYKKRETRNRTETLTALNAALQGSL